MTGIWIENPTAYQQKLEDLLGDRDPLEVLAETPALLARLVETHTVEQLRRRPYEGKWTPNEILGHLVDAEWIYGFRIRHVLCDDEPVIHGMDQDHWVARQAYNDHEPVELVDTFGMLRRHNLAVWRLATPEDLERTGLHKERGPESLGLMQRMHAGHDLAHLDQLDRYLSA